MGKIDSEHQRITEEIGTIYPIKPSHINAKNLIRDAFVNFEVTEKALKLCSFFQSKGNWTGFTEEELNNFFGHTFYFYNAFVNTGFIRKVDEQYFLTHDFICRCFMAAPNIGAD